MPAILPAIWFESSSEDNAAQRELAEYAGTLTWPVIVLTDALTRQKLETKLDEYCQRMSRNRSKLDSICKVAVLSVLLRDGAVTLGTAAEQTSGRFGPAVMEALGLTSESSPDRVRFAGHSLVDDLHNAFGVIEDYVQTGGLRTYQGTGLKLAPLQ